MERTSLQRRLLQPRDERLVREHPDEEGVAGGARRLADPAGAVAWRDEDLGRFAGVEDGAGGDVD